MNQYKAQPKLDDVISLVRDLYLPLGNIERAIPWPSDKQRRENDVEHSLSLVLVGCPLAERLGLDTGKVAEYAAVHDVVEIGAGDTSIWASAELLASKADREKTALHKLEADFNASPWLTDTIKNYESLIDEESRFVYALDKLIATTMIYLGEGHFWRTSGITYEMHKSKYEEIRLKVSKHSQVLEWFDLLILEIEKDKDKLFAKSP